jgi:peptidyl-prolyl cis-trans isomerase A (cyclophilin A)
VFWASNTKLYFPETPHNKTLTSPKYIINIGKIMSTNPSVLMQTPLGNITIKLFLKEAPITVTNFLHYVDNHLLDGSIIFRIVTDNNAGQAEDANAKINVIQAGLPPGHIWTLP